jgi:hypothetical protein
MLLRLLLRRPVVRGEDGGTMPLTLLRLSIVEDSWWRWQFNSTVEGVYIVFVF